MNGYEIWITQDARSALALQRQWPTAKLARAFPANRHTLEHLRGYTISTAYIMSDAFVRPEGQQVADELIYHLKVMARLPESRVIDLGQL